MLKNHLFIYIFLCAIHFSHKLEVQADISETASAVTCVSDKSGSASTKALAGSILNYKQANCDQTMSTEDGASERVRFDNMIYVLDGQYSAPLDQVSKLKFSAKKKRKINFFIAGFYGRQDKFREHPLISQFRLGFNEHFFNAQAHNSEDPEQIECNATSNNVS
jgi:hypothetical protein